MFYANFVLAKKGPLARVWLAAHWEKKLSKAHVFETDLQSSIESIISPKVKIALRTSGHLLLGVVRIYSRKAKYLLADCTEALIKIKMAFRPDVVDLPLDNQKAAISAITLPEFQEWDAMMNNMGKFDITLTLQNNQCRVEEITMKEDLFSSRYISNDNYFGDTPFGETSDVETGRDGDITFQSFNNNADPSEITVHEDELNLKESTNLTNQGILDDPMEDVGFGAGEGLDFFEDFTLGEMQDVTGVDNLIEEAAPLDDTTINKLSDESTAEEVAQEERDKEVSDAVAELTSGDLSSVVDFDRETKDATVPEQPTELATGIETTLFSRDTEAFALEPVEVTVGKEKKNKRKRKLIVDDTKILSSDQIKKQLNNTDDIVKPAVVAPTTRWRMSALETTLKTLTEQPISFRTKKARLNTIYAKNLTTTIPEDLALPSSNDDEEELQLEDPTEILRDAQDTTVIPDLTKDTIVEEVKEPAPLEDLQPIEMDIDVPLDNNTISAEEEIQIPPPFQLDVSAAAVTGVENISDIKDTEEETETENEKTDVQDKRWTKRTQQTIHMLEKAMRKKTPVNFKDLTKKCSRKQAAHRFYTLLTLNKEKCITVEQDGIFGDIFIDRGERFDAYA